MTKNTLEDYLVGFAQGLGVAKEMGKQKNQYGNILRNV